MSNRFVPTGSTNPPIPRFVPSDVAQAALDYVPTQYVQPQFKTLGKYDDGLKPGLVQEYVRSYNQGPARKYLNGFLSRAASIPLKVGQGLAHIAGLTEAVFTDADMDAI